MKIYFLGISSALVNQEADHTFYYVQAGNQNILIDCAGNPAGKLLKINHDPTQIHQILLTHLHIDHCYGLPALLFHMFLEGRTEDISVSAPDDEFIQLENQLAAYGLYPNARTFMVNAHPIKSDPNTELFNTGSCRITTASGDHGRSVRGFRIEEIETGIVATFSGDTRPNDDIRRLACDADILIHEATYTDKNKVLSQEYGHSTAAQAANIAQQAGVQRLALTHFDLIAEPDLNVYRREAAEFFHDEIIIPRELDWIELT